MGSGMRDRRKAKVGWLYWYMLQYTTYKLIGTITYVNGDTITGNFRNGRPDGVLLYKFAATGVEIEATYKQGTRIEWTSPTVKSTKKILKWLGSKAQITRMYEIFDDSKI